MIRKKRIISFFLAAMIIFCGLPVNAYGTEKTSTEVNGKSMNGKIEYIGNYSTGITNEEGGVAEIVKYNKENNRIYLVNGAEQSVDIVDVSGLKSGEKTELNLLKRLTFADMASEHGFTCGDITSVDVNTKYNIVALAVQAKKYNDPGFIVVLDYDGNYIKHYDAGVQPDMVCFTTDGNYILSANEGEMRLGYNEDPEKNPEDPEGSITIVDIAAEEAATVNFEAFDSEEKREELIDNNVLLRTGIAPSVDLEPEYIAVSEDSKTAYVSLQEANAIATLNISGKSFTNIRGLGFKNHSLPVNELDAIKKDEEINIKSEDLYGVYMPDGLATINIGGTQYVLTPNEGDAREWPLDEDAEYDEDSENAYTNLEEYKFENHDNSKLEILNNELTDGLESGTNYILGGRSFSIWKASDMSQVYDSGSDFERITAEQYPDYFNCSNKNTDLDDRSGKKGPEPEDVKTLKVGDKVYAFIGLERISGIMMYDITNPAETKFADYINVRNFEAEDLADSVAVAPEGLCPIESKYSPTGHPLLLVANEVSGTVSVFEIDDSRTVTIASISDPHYFEPSLGTTGAAFQAYLNQDRKLIAESSAISRAAVDKLEDSDADIVLVTGDLTKDGEKISHNKFAELLKELEDSGKKVYVVAGNHDINNPNSKKYVDDNGNPTDEASDTPYVTPDEFKTIYNDFGFGEAIAKDPNSLSYVAEPVDGLWIISMDSALYNTNLTDNPPYPKTAGTFSQETLNWILNEIQEGRSKGKRVIGMTHHGIVEHFECQDELFDEYVIEGTPDTKEEDDWQQIANALADAGMEAVYTGHFHANDIAKWNTEKGNTIYDIETGSLVTAPIPYRISTYSFSKNTLNIKTDHIDEINYPGAENFPEYSHEFLISGLNTLVENLLPQVIVDTAKSYGMEIDKSTATYIIKNIPITATAISGEVVTGTAISMSVNALAAHYAGDEAQYEGAADQMRLLAAMSQNKDPQLSPIFQLLAEVISSIYDDPEPTDNNAELALKAIPEPAPTPDDDDDDDDDDDNSKGGKTTPEPTPKPAPAPEPTVPTPEPEINFGDVSNHWAESLIKEAVKRNLFKGVENNSFEPDRNITRAEIAAVLVRGLNLQAGGTNNFSDVNSGDWFHNDISAVFSNGLMRGYGDGTARPNNPITRQEAMVIIAKALQYKGMNINISEDEISQYLSAFGDSESISGWARQYAAICVKSKIFEGSSGLLRPGDNITRAEAVKIIIYLLNL